MRLIDADAFIEEARRKVDMQDLYLPVHIKELVIDEMPTVDAIPIDWIKEKQREYMASAVLSGNGTRSFEDMVVEEAIGYIHVILYEWMQERLRRNIQKE